MERNARPEWMDKNNLIKNTPATITGAGEKIFSAAFAATKRSYKLPLYIFVGYDRKANTKKNQFELTAERRYFVPLSQIPLDLI